jgi:hypothetical protein
MKAPNKIYVHVRTEPRPSITFSEVLEKNSTNEEYIRKDVLLEWAQEHKRAIETHGDERNAYDRGEYSVLNFLIDKIKSL